LTNQKPHWITQPPPTLRFEPIHRPEPEYLRRLHALWAPIGHHLPHLSGRTQLAMELLAWAVAALWLWRPRAMLTRLNEVPNLADPDWDLGPAAHPDIIIMVPARNEEATLGPAMATLIAQEYAALHILALDDRSTDGTGPLLDELSRKHPDKLWVAHLDDLPEGWLGKTWALESAMRQTQSPYVLFTDADVWLAPSIIRRSLAYAEWTRADHLVVLPSPEVRSWGEGVMLCLLQLVGLWAVRPWLVADPQRLWDAAGVGAFNLLRRDAWEELGGFEPQRMAVLEDVTLGRRVKAACMRQRLAFAPGRVRVHWAPGMAGIVRGMGKNLFASVNFSLAGMALVAAALIVMFVAPLCGLLWPRTAFPCALVLACIAAQCITFAEVSEIEARFGWFYPLGVLALLWAMLRSVALAYWQRGIVWRGTHYPLHDLRANNSPFTWRREAARARTQLRSDQRRHRRNWFRSMRKER
jgi:glycosyltransferase involved in cell wall biosynthesis